MNEETSHKSSFNLKAIFKEVLLFAVIAVGIVLPFRAYVAEPYLVDGRSMFPTFNTGDYLIVKKFWSESHTFERNSVIVFKYPNDTSKSFIKRVIGLPGEKVSIRNGVVTIMNSESPDGIVLDEPFVEKFASTNYEVELSGDEYFVMGDNRLESFDSRSWGPLKKSYILGKPFVQLLPISKIQILK
ncbi:MAG: signal peptidase I [Patescibacteria group bacterium]